MFPTDELLSNIDQVSMTVSLVPTRLVWSDTFPWLLSGDSLKGQFQCKMDLGYVLYDNELERSFWSTKTTYRRIL